MRAIAINGSPHARGNTAVLLQTVGAELEREGIAFELLHVGHHAVRGCMACGKCAKLQNRECALDDGTPFDAWFEKMAEADAILLGSPVYYSGIAGTLKCFLDRAFYVAGANGNLFRHKVGASVVAVRRSGGVTTFDQLNHYLTYAEMMLPSSNYWTVGHGTAPGEATADLEGIQAMGVLGRNLAYLMKLVEAGKGTVTPPAPVAKTYMHFVR